MTTNSIELDELIGEHILTGCDTDGVIKADRDYYEDANVIDFVLDGRVISAIENPEDGYRSCMKDLIVGRCDVRNVFEPCKVIGERRKNNPHECDIVDLRDAETGLVVISVGTNNTDDYYPWFVADFDPKAMKVNQ